jgi:hypothetical protein
VGTGLRNLDTDGITGRIIGGALDVQRYRGPGMLEPEMSSDRSDTSGASVSQLFTP